MKHKAKPGRPKTTISSSAYSVSSKPKRFPDAPFRKLRVPMLFIAFGIIGTVLTLLTHAATPNSCTPNAILVNPCRPLYGVAMATQTPYSQVASDPVSQMLYQDQRIGHTSDIAHMYDSPGHNVIPAAGITLINDGYTLMLNWKPASPWVDGSNGSDNAAIDAMAASLESVAPHKVMLVIWHEPENDVSPGGADCTVSKGAQGTAAQYVAMWQYTVNRLRADGVTNAVYVEYFENYPPLTCNNINQLYAGDSYVDWIGFDSYVNSGALSDQSWDTVVSRFYSFLTTNSNSSHDYLSKPWMISELGVSNIGTTDEEAWYNQAAAAVTADTFPNLKAYVDYDDNNPSTGVAENRQAYSDSEVFTQAKQDAYNNFVDAIYNLGTTTTPTPTPTPDTTPPTVSLTTPANGATVSGDFTVSASASDNVGVSKVELYIDGQLVATDTNSPYTFSVDSTKYSNGSHTMYLEAFDAASNHASTASVTVTIQNDASSGAAPGGGSSSSSQPTGTINAATSSTPTPIAVSGNIVISPAVPGGSVSVKLDGKAINGDTINTTKLTNGVHELTVTENGKTKTQMIRVHNPLPIALRNDVFDHPVASWSIVSTIIILVLVWVTRRMFLYRLLRMRGHKKRR